MAKRSFYQLVWRELHWQRPYTQEQVCDILSHLASTIPRGAIIWEARGHGGYLYIPPEPCARIITGHAARTIREIVKDKQKRRALSKGLRDCFRWANETVTLYPDGKDSFFFTTKSGCPKNGGLILHEGVRHGYPCLYYCVHT